MQNIADDRDPQTCNAVFVLANCERIQQSLRRMFMRAITGIHDRSIADFC